MIKHAHKKTSFLCLFGMILLLISVVTLQIKSQRYDTYDSQEKLNYLPSGTFLKGMALGYDEALADLLWVHMVGYFGAHIETDRDLTWLAHMLELIIILDPRYESPYEFAGIILPSEMAMVDEGIAFMEKGLVNIPKHNPRYWLQPFYLGYCYMIYKNDPIKAARYFEDAASYPQSPKYLPLLAARLYANADKPAFGLNIISKILNDPANDFSKQGYWKNAFDKRINELTVAFHIDMLENAVSDYSAKYSQKASSLQDLVDGLILPFIPEEPFGGAYFLSLNGDMVLSSISEKRLGIHIPE